MPQKRTRISGSIVPFEDGGEDLSGWLHPEFQRQAAASADIQADGRGNANAVIAAIQRKGPAHFADGKASSILQRAGIRAGDIGGVAFTGPPTDQAGGRADTSYDRWRHHGRAFARTARR